MLRLYQIKHFALDEARRLAGALDETRTWDPKTAAPSISRARSTALPNTIPKQKKAPQILKIQKRIMFLFSGSL